MRIPSPLLGLSWRLARMPGLRMALFYQGEMPEPFLTHLRIEDMLSYPKFNSNNDIKFVVDVSNRCADVQVALFRAFGAFAYEGNIREPNGLWEPTKWMPLFHGTLSEEEQQQVAQSLAQKKLPIDALLKVASPASFGKDGETIFDPAVRKAFEIPRNQLPSELIDVLKFESDGWLENKMMPIMMKWKYHLYKIHMYGPGGKFEDHADTLHQSKHVATVVLSLPSEHVGGILRIRHHGDAIEFDSSIQDRGSSYLKYGAFFTDCTHSVQEVISGWRVVVQYDVYEEVDEKTGYTNVEQVDVCLDLGKSIDTSVIHDKDLTELMQAVSQYMAKIPPEDGVAFFLRHRYSLPALNEVVLKGADRTIYDAFSKRPDLSVSVQGLLAYIETEEEKSVSVEVKAVSMKDFSGADDQKEVANPAYDKERMVEGRVHLIVDEKHGAVRVHQTGGYMGNEASDDYTSYYVACMIIRSKNK